MPLRFDIRKKLTARSDRVKSVDLHPTEPWMAVSLYSGTIVVWNYQTQTIVKTFEECIVPVRTAKFIARKYWVIAGGDDMMIRVFNYNTLSRVHMFEAHEDYIRCIAVHPTQPYILSSSDDMLIKLWDWERKWLCMQVFEGHRHYVMNVVFNPKDSNQFASASLDKTVKVWQLGSKSPNFTLEGHTKGVNCVSYYSGGDKPYLISGGDDCLAKIWDYQNKTCIQTLEGHTNNISCISLYPQLPIILTGSEDGTIQVWHSNTYRLENTLHYNLERAWCLCTKPFSNIVALGFDNGTMVIQLGREEPAMSMDSSGKIVWARGSEVQQANLKTIGEAAVKDGEKLLLCVKDMGSSEIHPQTIQHSPNGRFVAVCGDGEYIIYTAMALRNKSFGSAEELVWAQDSSQYAIREGNTMVKIFRNFKKTTAFKVDFGAEGIFGGVLLGVKSRNGLTFYDWEQAELIRRVDIQPKHIFWSDSGGLVCIATDESFFVLRYLSEEVAAAKESKMEMTQDGLEGAFEVLGETQEGVTTGLWVGDCFIYTSSFNRLNYYVGGKIVTIAHLDRTMYLLGYIPKENCLYLGDMELNVVSYVLVLSVLEYQTAVMRKDFSTADKVLPTIPREQRIRVAYFLEEQGFKQQALAVSSDPEHKFELALQLGDVQTAYQLASEAKLEQKWRQLAKLATTKCQFSVAQECLLQAQDYGGLLLLATASGSGHIMENLAEGAERNEKTNVAFLTYFLQGRLEKCLDVLIKTDRLPEAAFLARTYLPSHVSRVVKLWKESLSKVNLKAADSLADPSAYSNLFPGLQQARVAEQYLKEATRRVRPAADYPLTTPNEKRNVMKESTGFVSTDITEPKVVARGLSEPVKGAASEPLKEELTPQKEEVSGQIRPVQYLQSEDKSIKTLACGHPDGETDNMEPKHEECDERAIAGSKDFVEEVVQEASVEFNPTETVKPFPLEDVALIQSEVQMISLAEEAVSPVCKTKPESIDTTDGETSKILVSAGLIACAGKSLAIANFAAEDICGQEELVSEGSVLVAPSQDLISSGNTTDRDSGEPGVAVSATEPSVSMPDPPRKKRQVTKPFRTQEQQEEKPEDNQKGSAPLGTELRDSSPDRARSEENTDTNPDRAVSDEEEGEEDTELDDKNVPPDDGALSAAHGVIETSQEETEETLVSPGETTDVSEFADDSSVREETETDLSLLEASLLDKVTQDEIDLTHRQVADTALLVAQQEDPIFSESTAGTAPTGPALVQTFTKLTLEPLGETNQILRPQVAQEQEDTEATGPGDNQESSAPLGTEPRALSLKRAPSEGGADTDGDSVKDEDEEAELLDTSIPPDKGSISTTSKVTESVEKPREMSALEETLVCLNLTSDVAESVSAAAAQTEMGPDVIPPAASVIVNTPEDETCVTDALVSDTSPPIASQEETIFSKVVARPLSGSDQVKTITNLALDPLFCPSVGVTPVVQPSEEEQERESSGSPKNSQEVGTPGAEPNVKFTDIALLKDSIQGQESQLHVSDEPKEDLETDLDAEDVVPVDKPLAASLDAILTTVERTSDTSSPEEIFVGLDWASVPESSAGEEMSSREKLEADAAVLLSTDEIDATELVETEDKFYDNATTPVPGGPILAQTLTKPIFDSRGERTQILKPSVVGQEQEKERLSTALLPKKPGEVSIFSENAAGGDTGAPDLIETFTELALDHLLDPPTDQAQIMTPAAAPPVQEEEEKERLDDSQEPASTLGAGLRFSPLDRALSVGNTDVDQTVTSEDADTEVDVELLDDQDLDDLDLEDIDTSEINLDEELLSD